jgi:hypothetical protein
VRIHSLVAVVAFAGTLSLVELVSATGQRPSLPRPSPQPTVALPPQPAPGAPGAIQRGNVTFSGCLYREDQFTSFKPDPARAADGDQFVLADAKSQDPAPTATGTTGTAGAPARIATTFKIEQVPAERLKTLVGKRVEVVGRVDPEPAAPGRMAELEASQIREVEGGAACPATPTA